MSKAIGYSLNAFPSDTLDEIRATLSGPARLLGRAAAGPEPLAVELRLGAPAIEAVRREGRAAELEDLLASAGLRCVSLNGFPLSPFHARRVKEDVFRPSWLEEDRVRLTLELAEIGAALAAEGDATTLSTLSGSFKPWGDGPEVRSAVARNVARAADGLRGLFERTGRRVVLCVEAEPFTTFETLPEIVELFERTGPHPHLAANLDCSHQAVEFEDPDAWMETLKARSIPLGKVHLTHALSVKSPGSNPAGIAAIRRLKEERYLHQTIAGSPGAVSSRAADIPDLDIPGAAARAFRGAAEARVHFHLPLFLEGGGGFETTHEWTARALRGAWSRDECRHFMIETYTWSVLAGRGVVEAPRAPEDLAPLMAREIEWARAVVGRRP